MAAAPNRRSTKVSPIATKPELPRAIGDTLAFAEDRGLLTGPRTLVFRGRMPAELVARAKQRTGVTSDSKLIELALANIALEDENGEWLQGQWGTVSKELDLDV